MRVRPLRPALALFVFSALALASPAADNGRKPDLQQLKRECELFETIVLTALGQAVPNPLFIAEKPRGAEPQPNPRHRLQHRGRKAIGFCVPLRKPLRPRR